MAEPKRIQFTTVTPKKDEKIVKKSAASIRLDLTLGNSTDTSCPEFFYIDLVKKIVGPEKSENGKPNQSTDDPFGDDDADQEKMAAIAKQFEEKYGPKPVSKKRKKLGRIQDLVDLGDGYDVEDPFIDNSEAYDEVVPASLTTRLGGFYINSGKLDFKEAKDDSEDDFVMTKKKGKKRLITSDSESEDEEKSKKKRKLKEEMLSEKKKKKMLANGEKSFKKPKKPIDKEKIVKKKKMSSPTVSELLKQQTESTSAPVSHSNGNILDIDSNSASTNDESSQDAKSYNDRIDSVIDSVIAMSSGGDQGNLESILDSAIGLDKEDANWKDDGNKFLDPTSIPSLPLNMPKELELTISFLKEKAKTSRDGKCKFFTNEVNDMLLVVEMESKKLGSCGHRSRIYNHLAAFLPCSKDTLIKRAKKLLQTHQDDEIKEPIQKLQDAINGMMPALQEKYELECQRLKQEGSTKEEVVKDNDTEDSENEKSQNPSDTVVKKGPKGVRKKFEWTESIRSLLCEIVRIKMKSFEAMKKSNQTAEEYLKQFLDRDIRTLWPPGWMQTRTLFKESRAAHSTWTVSSKPKKTVNVLMSKSTPNNSNPVTPTNSSTNNIPKFTPGSTPVRPSTYEEIVGEMTSKSLPSVGKAATTKLSPTLLDYANKDNSASENNNNSASSVMTNPTVSPGLSLLASSAASQQYMEKSFDHVVADIIKSSLSPKKLELTPSSVQASAKPSESFMEQFQKYAMLQQQQSQVDKAKVIDPTQAKKMANLLMQTKPVPQQASTQMLQRLKAAAQQIQPGGNTAAKLMSGKNVSKPDVRANAPVSQTKVTTVTQVSAGKPKTVGTMLSSEDIYRRFLQESGHNLSPNISSSSSSQPLQKSNMNPVRTHGQPSSQKSPGNLINTQGVGKMLQSGQKIQKSVLDFSSNPGNSQAHMNAQRTSPGQMLPHDRITIPGSQNISAMKSNSNSALSNEALQQLFGKIEGQSVTIHSYSKQPSPSSLHSYPKQTSPSLLNKSLSPSGMQNKSVSPSGVYSKTMSPTSQGKSQSNVWSIAAMTQGASKNNSSSPFSQPRVPQVHKPVPGYQNMKLPGVSTLPQSQGPSHLPSPEILSPLGLGGSNPMFPPSSSTIMHGRVAPTSPLSQQADKQRPRQ